MIGKMIGISLALLLTAGLTACGPNLQPEVDRLQAELDAANARIQELAEAAEAEQSRMDAEKQLELDVLQGKLEDAEAANNELQSRLDELEQKVQEEQAAAAAAAEADQAQPRNDGANASASSAPAADSASQSSGSSGAAGYRINGSDVIIPNPGGKEPVTGQTTMYNGKEYVFNATLKSWSENNIGAKVEYID